MNKGRAYTILSEEDKKRFARAVYDCKKTNPPGGWREAFAEGRKTLPKGVTIGEQITHPGHLSWIKNYLAEFEAEDKARPIIDHRNAMPKTDEPQPEVAKRKRGGSYKGMTQLRGQDQRLFAKACWDARYNGSDWASALKKANEALPEHKRFKKTSQWPSYYKWLSPLLEEFANERANAKTCDKQDPVPTQTTEVSQPQITAAPTLDFEGLLIGAIVNAAKQVLPQLAQSERFQSEMRAALAPSTAQHEKSTITETKVPRKKVVVVGLLSVQTNDVQKELGYAYDFRFVGAKTPSQQIKETAKNADIAILMTQFVSHPTQAAIRQHPGFLFCNGNSSALKHLLQEKLEH